MSRFRTPPSMMIVGLIAMAAFAVTLGGLTWLSHPVGMTEQISRITSRLAKAPKLSRPPAAEMQWAAQSVCSGAPERELTANLFSLAKASGVTIEDPVFTFQDARSPALARVTLQLTGEGSYDAAIGMLSRMARQRPALFVRSLDMKPIKGAVVFELTGAMWCTAV